jgi:hypothetical protein
MGGARKMNAKAEHLHFALEHPQILALWKSSEDFQKARNMTTNFRNMEGRVTPCAPFAELTPTRRARSDASYRTTGKLK